MRKDNFYRRRILQAGLDDIYGKVLADQRITVDDGLRLFQSPDLAVLGFLANIVRERKNGDNAFFIYNQHINYSNVCTNLCRFCAFGKDRGTDAAFQFSVDEIAAKVSERLDEPITEIHMVGGIHPDLPFSYYLEALRAIKRVRPAVHIQAFTCVELAHLADRSGLGLEKTFEALVDAGLGSIPGGGAEVFSPRIRKLTCEKKLSGEDWLAVAKTAHRMGLYSNATMLYGHMETFEERLEHLERLRDTQDETGGFLTFIPLAFHPKNTELSDLAGTTGVDDLKAIAVSRIFLDNFQHIKAYWVMIGPKLAQVALSFGADDIDGTVLEEKITRMAGGESEQFLGRDSLIQLIRDAGRIPVERDTLFQPIRIWGMEGKSLDMTGSERLETGKKNDAVQRLAARVLDGERLSAAEALFLYNGSDLNSLGMLADSVRARLHPEKRVSYVIDRNINYTDICVSACQFCAFFKTPEDMLGSLLSFDELAEKIRETKKLGGTQILLQGGLHPTLTLDYYEEMLRFMKSMDIHVHGFSPPEIIHFSTVSGLPVADVLRRLMAAGLDSMPGGGAEILVDRVRQAVSPRKCSSDDWLRVMAQAHDLGMRTTATMMFGHIETVEERIRHLERLRDLQDVSAGFTAFIPWTFQPGNTILARHADLRTASSFEYLKTLALSRIFLDNFPNIQASWVTQGPKIAQLSLFYGANDFGSTMIEENVVAATGVAFRLTEEEIRRLVITAGFVPRQRAMDYTLL